MRTKDKFYCSSKGPEKRMQKSNKEISISGLVCNHVTFAVYPKCRAAMMPKRFADVASRLLMRRFADVLGN